MESRVLQAELMDAADLAELPHRRALRGLTRVNLLSSTAAVLWNSMRRYQGAGGEPLRVLDVGCGAGDVLISLARRAAREGVAFEGVGYDKSLTAIKHARELVSSNFERTGQGHDLQFKPVDVLRDEWPEEFEVAMCSLFLHHLAEDEAVDLLRRMAAVARRAVLVDDLVRSRAGYGLAWAGTRILSRSAIVHADGPLSVKAAFTVSELRSLADRAGLREVRIRRHWPCRMLMTWSRR